MLKQIKYYVLWDNEKQFGFISTDESEVDALMTSPGTELWITPTDYGIKETLLIDDNVSN